MTIHRYVADRDAALRRAREAGATVKMAAEDMFWGDRCGVVTDPFGHTWAFATHIGDLTPDEVARGAEAAFATPNGKPLSRSIPSANRSPWNIAARRTRPAIRPLDESRRTSSACGRLEAIAGTLADRREQSGVTPSRRAA